MAYATATRTTITLDEGDAVVLLPSRLSAESVRALQMQLEKLAAGLSSGTNEDGQSHLRGLTELAAYMAN